ncbi:BrnT family toxin [Brucella intermedia]|uniref:BrnT family toxin n=1 Tax=Brucella intermedia M86 TaxID=1234597 RepID=M5K277_9HYPH|nr:BrnT family toxin [Brucella intermedia]ELT50984.1 hypothetical protein D584_01283 [Brucella intermedia M86]
MKIVWDEPKRAINIQKHGFDFAELTEEFFESATIEPAKLDREMAIGEFKGELIIAVVHKRLGTEAISVISMRHASDKEKEKYHGE